MSSPANDRERRVDEAIAAYLQADEVGAAPERETFLAAHPDLRDELSSFLDDRDLLRRRAHVDPGATLGHAPQPMAPLGTVRYFGDYELLEEIARGGMGVAFKARQVTLKREVALKMILAGSLAGPADVARFRSEAQAAATLDHPNVCPIYEIGEHQGLEYYSMKLIAGGSLAGRVAIFVQQPREAAELLAKVADAVQHAHQRGILHRDLKPANVLVDADGTPYVADFGLARSVEGGGLTQSGAIVGTPAYVAPEQAAARKDLMPAVDVYALGAILYECLTGQPPFSGPSPLDVLMQVTNRAPVPPRQINARAPSDLETIALKCLEKEPQRRYASAAAVADELHRWLDGRPILARPAGRAWRWCRRNPVVAGLLAATILSLLAGTISSLLFAWHARSKALAAISAGEEKERALEQEAHARREARWQLARQYVSRGRVELDKGEVQASLPWYVEALALEDDDPRRSEVHRRRLGELLCYCPRLANVLLSEGQFSVARMSDDGKHVLTVEEGVRDRVALVRIWDATTGQPLCQGWVVPQSDVKVGSVAFSPDGSRVAVGTIGGVQVRAVPSGRLLVTIQVKGPTAPTWHPSGKSLLVRYSTNYDPTGYDYDAVARLFDADTGRPLAPAFRGGGSVYRVRFSPDGKLLATVTLPHLMTDSGLVGPAQSAERYQGIDRHQGRTKTITHLRDGRTGADLAELPAADVTGMEFNPAGSSFVTTHRDGTARIWDAATRKTLRRFKAGAPSVRLSYSGDGRHLLAADDRPPRWLSPDGEVIAAAAEAVAPEWPAGPNRAVLLRDERGVLLWQARKGAVAPLRRIACPDAADFAQLSPDGRTLLTVRSAGRAVYLWDVGVRPGGPESPGEEEGFRYQDAPGAPGRIIDWRQDGESVGEVRFAGGEGGSVYSNLSADGRRLYVVLERAGEVCELRAYDVPSLKESFPPADLGVSKDANLLLLFGLAESAGRLAVIHKPAEDAWKLRVFESGKLLGAVPLAKLASEWAYSVRISGDGSVLAASWKIKDVTYCRAWSLPGVVPLFEALAFKGVNPEVAGFGPDNRYLSLTDGQVIDLSKGAVAWAAPRGSKGLHLLAGDRAVAATDAEARVWDLRSGKPLTLPMPGLRGALSVGPPHVLHGFGEERGEDCRLAFDALTGEAITVPPALGVTLRKDFPAETRPVGQVRLLASVLSGRHLDAVGAVVPLEPEEYADAWTRLCEQMPQARRPTAEEEIDWHRDEAAVAESWGDWKTAEPHRRRLAERAPGDEGAQRHWANTLGELGRWADARRECLRAAERVENPFHLRVAAAWASLGAGDKAQFGRDVRALLRLYEKSASSVRAAEMVRLAAVTGGDAPKRSIAITRQCPSFRNGDVVAWETIAAALAGEPKALKELRGQLANATDKRWLLLAAVALRRNGQADDATEVFTLVEKADTGGHWRDRLLDGLLRAELK